MTDWVNFGAALLLYIMGVVTGVLAVTLWAYASVAMQKRKADLDD